MALDSEAEEEVGNTRPFAENGTPAPAEPRPGRLPEAQAGPCEFPSPALARGRATFCDHVLRKGSCEAKWAQQLLLGEGHLGLPGGVMPSAAQHWDTDSGPTRWWDWPSSATSTTLSCSPFNDSHASLHGRRGCL